MNADQCVHCGLCLSACPTYEATGLEVESPRGRLVLLNEWANEPDAAASETFGWLDDCLDCRACEAVCPAHVPTGHLVESWRASAPKPALSQRLMSVLTWLIGSPTGLRWLRRLSRLRHAPVAKLALSVLGPQLSRTTADLSDGLPPIDQQPISRDRFHPVATPTAMLFVGCIMDAVYAESNQHTAALLELAGEQVAVPVNQRCCGALHIHAGRPQDARSWARHNILAFEESHAAVVVVNAAGCGTALKEYPALFADDPVWAGRANRFSQSVRDVLEVLGERPLPEIPPSGEAIAVHDACHHAHAQGITDAPRTILRRAGYRLEEMADSSRCCGSAGVYNLTHPELSHTLQQKKVADIPTTVELVAAANPGCMLQIQSGVRRLGRPDVLVRHPVDLIYDAYQQAGYFERTGGRDNG